MLRRRTMTKAFLVGIHELEKKIGVEETENWLRKIGQELAESEGPGIMGDQVDDLNCFRICLFAPKLDEFLEEFGSPEGHEELLKYVKAGGDSVEGPAAVNVCCSLCHTYRKRRAELAGKKDVLHLGAKYKMTGAVNLSRDAISEVGYDERKIKKLLKKYDCINKYVE